MSVVLKLSFIVTTEQKNMIAAPPVSSTGHLNEYSARSAAKTQSHTFLALVTHHLPSGCSSETFYLDEEN